MENINFSFATVIGLLGLVVALCIYIFNRLLGDITDFKDWQLKQDGRLNIIEKTLEKTDLCFDYIKRDLEDIKKDIKQERKK